MSEIVSNVIPTSKKFKDLTDEVFDRLTVKSYAYKKKFPSGTVVNCWNCKCKCGNTLIVSTNNLRSGHTRSCGCLMIEINTKLSTTHGYSCKKSLTYRTWRCMRDRCNNKNNANYKYYGKRGITICARWNNDFSLFLLDMGERPGKKYTLDRIDSSKGYFLENCRWATKQQQADNMYLDKKLTFMGITCSLREMAKNYNINENTLWKRLYGLGWDLKKALLTPIDKKCSTKKKKTLLGTQR